MDFLRKCLTDEFLSEAVSPHDPRAGLSPEEIAGLEKVGILPDSPPVFEAREVRRAIDALAVTAHDIRDTYSCKGWKVKNGLVHGQDHDRLRSAAGVIADKVIVDWIMLSPTKYLGQRIAEPFRNGSQWTSRQVRDGANQYKGWDAKKWIAGIRHPYEKLGEMRARELCRGNKGPYLPQARDL